MSEPIKLPNSPNDMPSEIRDDQRYARRVLSELKSFPAVAIHFEKDISASNASGESVGEWEVSIVAGRNEVSAKGNADDLLKLLWYCAELAHESRSAQFADREKARANALAKLTDEDKKALRLAL